MTATLLPPAAKSTMDAVRDGLADIRDRVSDLEALPDFDKLNLPDWDKVAHNTQDLFDRATGRKRRRPGWPRRVSMATRCSSRRQAGRACPRRQAHQTASGSRPTPLQVSRRSRRR